MPIEETSGQSHWLMSCYQIILGFWNHSQVDHKTSRVIQMISSPDSGLPNLVKLYPPPLELAWLRQWFRGLRMGTVTGNWASSNDIRSIIQLLQNYVIICWQISSKQSRVCRHLSSWSKITVPSHLSHNL